MKQSYLDINYEQELKTAIRTARTLRQNAGRHNEGEVRTAYDQAVAALEELATCLNQHTPQVIRLN